RRRTDRGVEPREDLAGRASDRAVEAGSGHLGPCGPGTAPHAPRALGGGTPGATQDGPARARRRDRRAMARRAPDGEVRAMGCLRALSAGPGVLVERAPWRGEAEAVWSASRDGRVDAFISAAALPTLFYIVRKQADLARAHAAVVNCLRSLAIVPVG